MSEVAVPTDPSPRQPSSRPLSCPRAVKDEAHGYCARLARLAGENLVGVYLYGSLAHGCFNGSTSDVDLIVVLGEPCGEDLERQVAGMHRTAGLFFDATFVTVDGLNTMAIPAPVLFLAKADIVRLPKGSRDVIVQRQDVYEHGIALSGPAPRDLFRPVPWYLLEQCFAFLLPHVTANFKNPVLVLSRIAYAYHHRALCSKRKAGQWAVETFPRKWHGVIGLALEEYAQGVGASGVSTEQLDAFEKWCTGLMRDMRADPEAMLGV